MSENSPKISPRSGANPAACTSSALLPVPAAHDLVQKIPGAVADIVPGMGHDLPLPLLPRIAEGIVQNAARVVAPALNGFYAALSDQQKAGFDALGRPPRTPGVPGVARGER